MPDLIQDDPVWVNKILDWKWTRLIARTAMVGPFVVSGVMKLLDFAEAKLEMEAFGLHPSAFGPRLPSRCNSQRPLSLSPDASSGSAPALLQCSRLLLLFWLTHSGRCRVKHASLR